MNQLKLIQRIVIIVANRFHQRDYIRFGIKFFFEKGYDVEVWEILPYLNFKAYNEYVIPDPIDFKGHKCFFSLRSITNAVSLEAEATLFMVRIPYNLKTYLIYRKIGLSDVKICVFVSGALPNASNQLTFIDLSRKFIADPLRAFRIGLNRLPKLIEFSIRKADYCIVEGGTASLENLSMTDGKTQVIKTHHYDYELYYQANKKNILPVEIAVFLDEDVCFSPEYIHHKVKPFDIPEKYFYELCTFFDRFEKETGLEVVVAVHPRSIYHKKRDFYCGRKTIQGKTVELIQQSKMVLAHSSTSISFAVLFNKKIVFFTTDRLKKSRQGNRIENFSFCFFQRPINISCLDDKTNLFRNQQIDKTRYNEFISKYLKTSSSKNESSWQIAMNYFKNC